jgi:ubiquinone/menaquinone biosynthesis C-methylase UbiE
MLATDKVFSGSIPEIYDRYLVPLIFESYAIDLARRVALTDPQDVLERAAGTGVLTRAIASRLPECARILATDLNQQMLERAKGQQYHHHRIEWKQVRQLKGCGSRVSLPLGMTIASRLTAKSWPTRFRGTSD